jgi:hypothetical protein
MKRWGSALSAIVVSATLFLAACGSPDKDGAAGETVALEGGAASRDEASSPPTPEGSGRSVSASVTHVSLSPEAQIQAERFMCVCGCGLRLGDCTCEEDPGSVTMKRHLQGLVDRGLKPAEVKAAMLEAYGPGVLP